MIWKGRKESLYAISYILHNARYEKHSLWALIVSNIICYAYSAQIVFIFWFHDSIYKLLYRFVKRTLKSFAQSPSSSKPSMKQWRSVTNQQKTFAMVRGLRSVEQFMSLLAQQNMWRSSQENLLETHLVRSFQLRFVGLDAHLKRGLRNVMTK